jgi:hypothetical protein
LNKKDETVNLHPVKEEKRTAMMPPPTKKAKIKEDPVPLKPGQTGVTDILGGLKVKDEPVRLL